MSLTDLYKLTMREVLVELRERRVSSRDYVEALIDRSKAVASLNAIASHDWNALRAAADRADASGKAGTGLAGVPLCLKDNIATTDLPTGAATGALQGWMARRNAPVAQRLFEAGALLGAKGNMHELAFGITNNNAVTGAARNPWNPDMIPGGSSGGVAVTVAARMMPAGIGTDTGASVRLPASLCGLVGFRPSVGRYPGDGIVPISHTRDTAGPITRTVGDARLLDAVMADVPEGDDIPAPTALRIGVPRGYFFDNLDPSIEENIEKVLRQLAGAGVDLIEADIPDVGTLNAAISFPVALFEFIQDLKIFLKQNGIDHSLQDICDGVGSPDVKGVFQSQLGEEAMPESVYRQAMDVERPRLQAAYASYFADHRLDAAIFPTAPLPARPIGQDETVELNGEQVPTFPTFIRNTDPASNAAIPGISLPCGLSADSLPVGVELDGPAGSDDRLLAVAAAIEKVLGFSAAPDSI
ncbi:MAG: indoleacetamide hydrolase [Alphaproteobacteria bacterium]|nr:indoleacetamide hydrolase [Alphaproteobacteria bacterium]